MKVSESFENFTPEQLKVLKDSIDELIKNKESYEIVEKEEKNAIISVAEEDMDATNKLLSTENWFIAVQEGDIDAVEIFIKHKFDINVKDDKWGKTALMYASQIGKVNIIELLLKNGADINIKNDSGNTAIFYATRYSKEYLVSYKICELLIDAGANIEDIVKDSSFYRKIILYNIKKLK